MTDHRDLLDDELIEESFDLSKLSAFEQNGLGEKIPQGFNAVIITLNCLENDSLQWLNEAEETKKRIEQGYKLLFSLNLGLFDQLKNPLSHEAQFQTLSFSLEHFATTFLPQFQEHTIGVILAHLDLSFKTHFDQNLTELDFQEWVQTKCAVAPKEIPERYTLRLQELYFRDVTAEFLVLLANRLPPSITAFVLFDAKKITSPLDFAQLTAQDRFERLKLALKNPLFPTNTTVWQKGDDTFGYIGRELPSPGKIKKPTVGILMPSCEVVDPYYFQDIEKIFDLLFEQKTYFKVVPEEFLTTEWDGLDKLIIPSAQLSQGTMRKLQGFSAAGGEIQVVSRGQ